MKKLATKRFTVALGTIGLILSCAEPSRAWENKPRDGEPDIVDLPIAFETNSRGDLGEVFRDSDDKIHLRITLAAGFIQFAASNCPTIQIDQRTPVHHSPVGENCVVGPQEVTISLGDIVDKLIISLPLHRLMNGSQLAARFVTASGEYREAKFSLRNSKQAIQAAVGADTEVKPKLDDS